MAHDVFISYATEDRQVADGVCQALEEAGVRCWYAPRNIPYAVDYEEAIIDAISQSKLMLLVLSAHANDSAHVKREVQNACREEPQVPVLPFQIENVPLSKSFRYYIGSVHWLSALTPPLEDHLQKLVEYVRARLPQREQDEDSAAQSGQPAQAEIVGKDEEEALGHAEEALRLAEEVERRRVEEEERLAAEAEAQRKAEEERQRREAEEKRRAEEEAARLAAEERRREEEERERREAEERQRLEAEEAAKRQAEEERVRAEAEARRLAEQEAERLRVEAEQKAERRRLEEEKQAHAEEERREQEAAEAARRSEEERQQPEEEERRQREAVELKQRREEEELREKERQAEERRASEASFRELNLAAKQKRLEESSATMTAEDVSTPASKNKRVMLSVVGALITIGIIVAVMLTGRKEGRQQLSANQTATPTSTQETGPTMNAPLAAEATLTPSPTPEPIPTPDQAAFQRTLNAFIRKRLAEDEYEHKQNRKIVYGDLDMDRDDDAAVSFCTSSKLGTSVGCDLAAFSNVKGVLTYVDTLEYEGEALLDEVRYIKDGKIVCNTLAYKDNDPQCCPSIKGQMRVVLVGNKLKVR